MLVNLEHLNIRRRLDGTDVGRIEQMSGRRKDAEFTRLFRRFVLDRDLTYGNRFSLNDVVVWFGENAILGKKDKDIREQLCKHTTNDKRRIRFPKPADSSQDLFYSTNPPM
jgi:hypothetical protein